MDIPGPKTWREARTQIVAEAIDIIDKKRALRGTENISRQGLPGVVTRIAEDKLSRIQRAVEDQQFWDLVAARPWAKQTMAAAGHTPESTAPTSDDGLEDDLLDVLNYAIIAVALNRGWWSLP